MLPPARLLEYLSPFRYGFEVYAQNEYTDLELEWAPAWDPLKIYDFALTIGESVGCTFLLGWAMYLGAYLTLYYTAVHRGKK